MTTTTTSGVNI